MEIKKKLAKNTGFNGALSIANAAIYFFMMPFIIRHLGITQFGIYVLASSLVNYFGLLELGVSTSLIKYVSEYHARSDRKKLGEVISSTFFFYLGVGCVIAVLLFAVANLFLSDFNIPASLILKTRYLIYILAISTFISWPLSTFRNVLAGLQRYDLISLYGLVISGATAIATVLLLGAGFGLLELVAIEAFFTLLGLALLSTAAIRILGFLPVGKAFLNKQTAFGLAGFSLLIFLIQMANQISYKTDTLVIGVFLPVGAIALYEAANKMQGPCWRIFRIANSAVMPAASELNSTEKRDKLKELYLRGSKYTAALTLGATLALFLTAKPLLFFWLGPDFAKVAWAAKIFLSLWFFNAVMGITGVVLVGMGRPKVLSASVLIKGVLNLLLSVILVQKVGYVGVIFGTVLAEFMLFPVILMYALKTLEISLPVFISKVALKVYAPLALAGLAGYEATKAYEPQSLFQVGGLAATIMSVYLLIFFIAGISREEKRDIRVSFVAPGLSWLAGLVRRLRPAES